MRTWAKCLLVLSLFSATNLIWPTASSAQVLDDGCRLEATLDIPPYTATAKGLVTYTCTNPKQVINVSGCLLLNGLPVDCDGDTQMDSSYARVDLSFPCVPGIWTVAAVGAGAERIYPAVDFDGPEPIVNCDPLSP